MAIFKTINLDHETDELVDRLFPEKGRNGSFSAWVREKLIEEARKRQDEQILKDKISANNMKILELEDNNSILERELSTVIEQKQTQKFIKEAEEERQKPQETEKDKIKRVAIFVKDYFGINGDKGFELARELWLYKEELKIDDLTLAFVRFSIEKSIPFIEEFAFIKRYREVIEVKK